MKDNKKTEVITFRADTQMKNALTEIAKQNKWSISQVVEQLITNFIIHEPGTIIIKTEDIKRIYDNLVQEDAGAVEIEINMLSEYISDDEKESFWGLRYSGLTCGGLGCVDGFDSIRELSKDELMDT